MTRIRIQNPALLIKLPAYEVEEVQRFSDLQSAKVQKQERDDDQD